MKSMITPFRTTTTTTTRLKESNNDNNDNDNSNMEFMGSNENTLRPLQKGSSVALITPFDDSTGDVNEQDYKSLLQKQVQAGTSNICILGTTGEASSLSMKERELLISTAVQQVKGSSSTIMVGCSSISPNTVRGYIQQAYDLGADVALIVTPYYVKPPQRDLIQHYVSMANLELLPICMYNVPGRTGVDLSDESAVFCSQHDYIVGLKDATGQLSRLHNIQSLLLSSSTTKLQSQQQMSSGSSSSSSSQSFIKNDNNNDNNNENNNNNNLLLFSGDDSTCCDYVLQGGHGCISVTANIVPETMVRLMKTCLQQQQQQTAAATAAYEINSKLLSLHDELFVESNPIPIKYALKRINWISSNYCRSPLSSLDNKYVQRLEKALQQAELL